MMNSLYCLVGYYLIEEYIYREKYRRYLLLWEALSSPLSV
jgi:hypothetical protein